MRENFPAALSLVLKSEGGYTNHPDDPGGPTNWGITIADARMYWKKAATADDVRAMPIEVAKSIYKSKYWDRMDCDGLPAGLDYCTFDYGVNSGVQRAIRVLQSVHNLETDRAIEEMCDERMAFLQSLKTWPTFGKGWTRRVTDVRALALRMAATPAPLPPPPDVEPAPTPSTFWQELAQAIISIIKQL